jgi:hypothetical protein
MHARTDNLIPVSAWKKETREKEGERRKEREKKGEERKEREGEGERGRRKYIDVMLCLTQQTRCKPCPRVR